MAEPKKCENDVCDNRVLFVNSKYNNFCCHKCSVTGSSSNNTETFTRDEFIKYCNEYLENKSSKSLLLHIRRNNNLLTCLNEYSSHLECKNNGERLYIVLNSLSVKPVCIRCSKQVTFYNFNTGYYDHCSIECSTQVERNNLYVNIISIDCLKDIINFHIVNVNSAISTVQRIDYLYDSLKYYTTSLNKYDPQISERVYCLLNNISDRPKCIACGNDITFQRFSCGYSEFCCISCASTHEQTLLKRGITSFKNYGTRHPMQNKEVFDKNRESSYRTYKYKFKTGEEVLICGYENHALDMLQEQGYKFGDIDTQIDLNIWYYSFLDDNIHKYFPDIYIEKENRIIEVKSTYTYDDELEINLMKRKASKFNKYNFEFWLVNEDGTLNEIIN